MTLRRRHGATPLTSAHALMLDVSSSLTIRGIRNPGVTQCLGFYTADFWSSSAYESAEQKTKHCLTPGLLIPLLTIASPARRRPPVNAETPSSNGPGHTARRLTQRIQCVTRKIQITWHPRGRKKIAGLAMVTVLTGHTVPKL